MVSARIRRCASGKAIGSGTAAGTEARMSSRACSYSRSTPPIYLMCGSEQQNLLEGRNAVTRPVQADHAQSPHTLADRDLAQVARRGAGDDELADFVRDGHGFDDGEAARVT